MVASSQPLAVQAGLDVLETRRQCDRCRRATAAVLSVVEPMNVGPGRRSVRHRLHRRREEAVCAQREWKSAERPDTRSHERGRLQMEPRKLGAWVRHATRRDPDRHGPWRGLGMGGGAAPFRDDDVHRDAAASHRLRGAGIPDLRTHRIRLAPPAWHCRRAPGDPRGCCTQIDPDSIATWYIDGKPPAAGQSIAIPVSRSCFASFSSEVVPASTKATSRPQSSQSPVALGGTMTTDDLAGYSGQWMDVATTNYHGYDVATLPPPAQTWATDEMLNILESCVPVWAPGADACLARSLESEVLALPRRGEEAGVSATSTPTTPIPISPRCRSIDCCRNRTPRRSAAGSIPSARRDPLPLVAPTRAATRSCCPRRTDPATWWRG